MYRIVTLVNNTVLHIWNLLRIDLKTFSSQEKKGVTIHGDGCLLDLL